MSASGFLLQELVTLLVEWPWTQEGAYAQLGTAQAGSAEGKVSTQGVTQPVMERRQIKLQ